MSEGVKQQANAGKGGTPGLKKEERGHKTRDAWSRL